MPRIRTIKPEFWTSAQVLECSRNARLLFLGAWNFCDDAGRHPDNAKQIKAEVFPADELSLDEIRGMLDELSANGLISRYVHDSKRYFQVTGWHHQRIDKPQTPRYPGPFDDGSESIPGTIPERSRRIGKDTIGKDTIGKDTIGKDTYVESAAAPSTAGGKPNGGESNPATIVERIFAHWQQIHRHPRAALTEKRRKVIRQALKDYDEGTLCQAICGYSNSPHHMGDNDRGTVYDSIELMLRDAEHIDRGVQFYEQPPRRDQSVLTRRNVSATDEWVPPELRHGNE